MPEGLRNGTVAVGLAVLLVVFAWSVFVWHLGTYQERHRESDQQQAYANTGPTDPELYDLCLSGSPGATVECIREYVEASGDAQRAKDDLKAQQQMADWTLLMTWVSGAGVLVTAIGVIYVAATLAETRRATRAAIKAAEAADDTVKVTREIGQKQIRAYVGIDAVRLHMTPGGIVGTIVRVVNTGQTPAKNLISRITLTARPHPSDDPLPVPEKEPPARSRAILPSGKTVTIQNVVIPIPFDPQYQRNIANGRAAIFVHGLFTYEDIFGDQHKTKFCLYFTGAWGGERKMDVYHTGNEAD